MHHFVKGLPGKKYGVPPINISDKLSPIAVLSVSWITALGLKQIAARISNKIVSLVLGSLDRVSLLHRVVLLVALLGQITDQSPPSGWLYLTGQ